MLGAVGRLLRWQVAPSPVSDVARVVVTVLAVWLAMAVARLAWLRWRRGRGLLADGLGASPLGLGSYALLLLVAAQQTGRLGAPVGWRTLVSALGVLVGTCAVVPAVRVRAPALHRRADRPP